MEAKNLYESRSAEATPQMRLLGILTKSGDVSLCPTSERRTDGKPAAGVPIHSRNKGGGHRCSATA
jgi:hypothetical protein